MRVENNGGQPDWNFVRPPVSKVKVGTRLTVSVYVDFTSIPDNARISIVSEVSIDGQVVHRSGLTSTMNRSDAGDLWSHTGFTPDTIGKYAVVGIVTVNGQSKRATANLTVVKQVAPPPPPVSFHFDTLRTVDSHGRPVSVVTVTQRVAVMATWTVRNLTGSVPIWVTETLGYPTSNGWRPLGSPLQNSFDTSSGSHAFRFTFVPSTSYSSLRIVIGLTMGSNTQQRSVMIQLRR